MASERKIASNRSNALRSTGPRTTAGKRRVGRNALSHGLAVSILEDPRMCAEVERFARALAPEGGAEQLDRARLVAEAELEILRVRTARAALIHLQEIALATGCPGARLQEDLGETATDQYNETNASNREFGGARSGSERQARAFLQALPRLVRLDRYECRALSRRKRAIRELTAIHHDGR